MPHPKIAARLYLAGPLAAGQSRTGSPEQSHYLAHVLRLKTGATLALFNGADGVFLASVTALGKKGVEFSIGEKLEAFSPTRDITLCFAPIKRTPMDWLVQKATELGVRRLIPVLTARTENSRLNLARLIAIATEAAEQSERHDVPEIGEPQSLSAFIAAWPQQEPLFACIERPTPARLPLAAAVKGNSLTKASFLTGPEGGFSDEELALLSSRPFIQPVSLGNRILKAETASLAVLTVCQALFDAQNY